MMGGVKISLKWTSAWRKSCRDRRLENIERRKFATLRLKPRTPSGEDDPGQWVREGGGQREVGGLIWLWMELVGFTRWRQLLFIEHIHQRGGDELHDRVHDALLLLLLVAAAGGHRLLGAGQAALGGLLHGGGRLRLLLFLLLDAVLEQGGRANMGIRGLSLNTAWKPD